MPRHDPFASALSHLFRTFRRTLRLIIARHQGVLLFVKKSASGICLVVVRGVECQGTTPSHLPSAISLGLSNTLRLINCSSSRMSQLVSKSGLRHLPGGCQGGGVPKHDPFAPALSHLFRPFEYNADALSMLNSSRVLLAVKKWPQAFAWWLSGRWSAKTRPLRTCPQPSLWLFFLC